MIDKIPIKVFGKMEDFIRFDERHKCQKQRRWKLLMSLIEEQVDLSWHMGFQEGIKQKRRLNYE